MIKEAKLVSTAVVKGVSVQARSQGGFEGVMLYWTLDMASDCCVYVDYNATTPLELKVLEAITTALKDTMLDQGSKVSKQLYQRLFSDLLALSAYNCTKCLEVQ